jgi:hypothetical protein
MTWKGALVEAIRSDPSVVWKVGPRSVVPLR